MAVQINDLILNPCSPIAFDVRTTQSHPQLRDLIAPSTGGLFSVASDRRVVTRVSDTRSIESPRFDFVPTAIASGYGLLAVVGSAGQVGLTSDGSSSLWMTQQTISSDATQVSINNSVLFAPPSTQGGNPSLLVSSNDGTVKVYMIVGELSDYVRASKRRLLTRYSPSMDASKEGTVEETGVHSAGGPCSLVKTHDLSFTIAINHSSISSDGRLLCSVGDSNKVFIHSIHGSTFTLAVSFTNVGSSDACFSTAFASDSKTLAVGSQDGSVFVYDLSMLPLPPARIRSTYSPRVIAVLRSSQSGPSGAVRKLCFSSRHDLLAFSEHRSVVQVVDARTWQRVQTIILPLPLAPTLFPQSLAPSAWPLYSSTSVDPSGSTRPMTPLMIASQRTWSSHILDRLSHPAPAQRFSNAAAAAPSSYYPTSPNFPATDSSPEDVLGLAFDEYSDCLLVATGDKVYKYEINQTGRRMFDSFDFS